MAVNVVWFMALNAALMLPTLWFFLYVPAPYPWMQWLAIPALAGALMIGVSVQMKIRNKEESERRMKTF